MPRTSRPLRIHPIVLRRVQVVDVVDVSPNLRRITLGGPDLSAGEVDGVARPAFVSEGFDDHVKLVVPPAEGELPRIGRQEERRFAWNPEVLAYTRDYTVRSWDPSAGTFAIDVVRHDHGLASAWAYRARPGDEIHVAGPKSCALRNDEADHHLLVGDETALPAIARWLEEAPAGTRGRVVVEVPTEADRLDVPTAADVEVTWLVRGDVAPGTSRRLVDAVRSLELPAGRVYAWVAGEAMTIAPIRRHLRDLGLPKEDVEVVGYWRRPAEATTRTAPADDAERLTPAVPAEEDESPLELLHEVHEMTELLPPVVTRVAVTLGIPALVADGCASLAALADKTGVDAARLAPLLDAMTALGLLEPGRGALALTARGGVLAETDAVDELSLDNPANREALALVDLLDVLTTGRPPARVGETWRVRRAADPALDRAHHERAEDELQYVLEPLAELAPVKAAGSLAVVGDGAGLVAEAVARGRTVHLPGAAETQWPAADCAVLVGTLEGRDDAEALALLRTALAGSRDVVLLERTSDKAAVDDHAAERALLSLTLSGTPMRSSADLDDLIRRAGATGLDHVVLGWGFGGLSRATLAHG